MSRRPRVVMVLDWFVHYVAPIANALARDCDVMVVMRDHGYELGINGPAPDERRAMFAESVECVFIHGPQRSVASMRSAQRCRGDVRAFQPDILHAQEHSDWRLALAASGAGHAPRVLTIHDVSPHPGAEGRGNFVQKAVRGSLRRRADAIVVHGQVLVAAVEKQSWHSSRQRVVAIPVGALAQPAVITPPAIDPVVLFFGRLEPYKGLDTLAEAAELARERVPGLRVIVAGRGDAGARVRAMVPHADSLDWREGFIRDEDLPALFAESAVVVLPYREASQSGVVPVAFANGRAVIATNVGALAEAVEDGVDGLLVPPGDPSLLAEAMVSVLVDRESLVRLSAGAARAITSGRLSSAVVAAKHLDLYTALIAGEAAR